MSTPHDNSPVEYPEYPAGFRERLARDVCALDKYLREEFLREFNAPPKDGTFRGN